jgi:hypothetical protein
LAASSRMNHSAFSDSGAQATKTASGVEVDRAFQL